MKISIGILGDFDKNKISQVRTNESLDRLGQKLNIEIQRTWIGSNACLDIDNLSLDRFDGIWGAPGGFESPEGAINAIQQVRHQNIPYLGT